MKERRDSWPSTLPKIPRSLRICCNGIFSWSRLKLLSTLAHMENKSEKKN